MTDGNGYPLAFSITTGNTNEQVTLKHLEKRIVDYKFTSCEIISPLKEMIFYEIAGEGYVPIHNRTLLTDALHDAFKFRTDLEIVTKNDFKKILEILI